MLFDSSLRKELGRSFGATLVVLITVVMTVMLIRTLGQATVGRVNPSEVVLVMGYTVLGVLTTILTLSLFVAITATLTRMYTASEMVVWFSSGQGLAAFVKPLMRFALPILVVVAVMALMVSPWANLQIRELRDRYQGRGDIERVAPGRFIESSGGRRVFFIDRNASDERSGSNIFVVSTEHGKESVISAKSGEIKFIDDERFIVLNNGYQLDTDLATGESRVSEFAQYGHRIDAREVGPSTNQSPRIKTTSALLVEPTPRNLAELSWRIGQALIAFNCVLIALAATRVNPRVGRSASLIFTLLAFAAYYNLIGIGESWITDRKIGAAAYMLLLHGGIFALAMVWLVGRHEDWLMRWSRRRTGKQEASA
ncbi:LPS export ABC transporter permease LptF [Ottowia sp.]|uniref:LPS export ABC transporter permease LptF n=1 Tax=Ottowia sp. TaxID=1898956 RepID=UPI003A890FC1